MLCNLVSEPIWRRSSRSTNDWILRQWLRLLFSPQYKPCPSEYCEPTIWITIFMESIWLGKNQGGAFHGEIFVKIFDVEKGQLLESTYRANMSFASRHHEWQHDDWRRPSRKVDFHHNYDASFGNRQFDDQHHQHEDADQPDPEHQVEGVHYRHHPHQGHCRGELRHQFCHYE